MEPTNREMRQMATDYIVEFIQEESKENEVHVKTSDTYIIVNSDRVAIVNDGAWMQIHYDKIEAMSEDKIRIAGPNGAIHIWTEQIKDLAVH